MRRYVLSRPAGRDLDQIRIYLTSEAGPGVARRVLSEIRQALRLLADKPGRSRSRGSHKAPSQGLATLLVSDHLRPEPWPIHIIRVLHGMRDIESILN